MICSSMVLKVILLFLCHYICDSPWPGLEINRERVIAFITPSKICSLAFVKAHLLPDFANFTGLVKGGEGQSRAMLLIILKGKSTLNLNLK